ncbi:MAG: sigma 54-interacting transcriptional regulator, partial [Deltaproteobacteria bacterium]|nr:sigma 54-interacting transcriptional regulator [Deltaproteobacteria bacterium]
NTLVESLLFGHEKGAFTGAESFREGLIKQADGGTLVLDEIGELPLTVQKEFLRGLQERRFRPLGSDKEIHSDFRLISTTNRDMKAMVQSKRFREDLYFRIQTVSIELPPLRKRADDIKELAMHYMVKLCQQYGSETKGVSSDFLDALSAYDWPGNVRELINTMESVLTFAWFEPTLFPRHLPAAIRVFGARAAIKNNSSSKRTSKPDDFSAGKLPKLQIARRIALAEVEKDYLEELMRISKGNIKQVRSISGLSQSRLYHLLKKYKIRRG